MTAPEPHGAIIVDDLPHLAPHCTRHNFHAMTTDGFLVGVLYLGPDDHGTFEPCPQEAS